MARATAAQAEGTVVDWVNTLYDWLVTNAPDLVDTNTPTIIAGYNGDEIDLQTRILRQGRSAAINVWNQLVSGLTLALNEWGKADTVDILQPFPSEEAFRQLRNYLSDIQRYSGGSVDKKVTARGWTRSGSDIALTGLTIYRLTVDHDGQPIEQGWPQVITAEAIQAPNAAISRVKIDGEPAGIDVLEILGSGSSITVNAIDENNTAGDLLTNPLLLSGDITDGNTITSTDVSGWTLAGTWTVESTAATVLQEQTNVLRCAVDASTLTQELAVSAQNIETPYVPAVWVNITDGTFVGSIDIDWGGKTQNILSTAMGSNWTLVAADRDKDLYPRNWDEANADVKITVNVTSGNLLIGAVHLVPMFLFDSTYYSVFANDTPPLTGANASITDTLSVAGKINHILAMAYPGIANAFLPTTGTNTIADP